MAECGLCLVDMDYGFCAGSDFTWKCPECDGKIDDYDDAVLGYYSNGIYVR